MSLIRRRRNDIAGGIWPGFVDAMTALLLVLMFVLSIFMVMQFVMSERIVTQTSELDTLADDINKLSEDLVNEQGEKIKLAQSLQEKLDAILALKEDLFLNQKALENRDKSIAETKIKNASLKDLLEQRLTELEAAKQTIALARSEIDQKAESARLAAAKREALEALIANLTSEATEKDVRLSDITEKLTEAEKTKLVESAAAELLKKKLASADTELDAMTLALAEAEKNAKLKDLEKFRSEFFGRLRDVLGNREGVRVVGDRFVFSSEVLFPPGSSELGGEGKAQIANVAKIVLDVAGEIPDNLNWILRVDGHTDNVPLTGGGQYADNWELSQARALSVVRYLVETQDVPADRLAAAGFGEFQPVNTENTQTARDQNRRIEIKLTEK